MKGKVVRVGCSSAFWGDSPAGAWQLVNMEGADLDYLVADYLSEVTMAILARQKHKAPCPPPPVLWGALLTGLLSSSQEGGEGGFVREFVQFVCKPLMKQLLDNKTKVVTNAGGATPLPSSFFEEGGGLIHQVPMQA